MLLRTVLTVAIAATISTPSVAGELFDINHRHEPAEPSAGSATLDTAGPAEPFGTSGQEYLTISGSTTTFSTEATDLALGVAYSRFLTDDFEWINDLRVMHSNQSGDNVVAGNFRMLFRYHAINRERWTVFGDIGIGVLVATDEIPNTGTVLNFTPTLGIGATWSLPNSNARLVGGVRWHHISNARIESDRANPSRDDAALFFGVSFRL